MSIRTFLIAPEHILLPFFKIFFSQEVLHGGIENIFRYKDNLEQDSLIIEISETSDTETPNAMPALTLQEGGFSEEDRILDGRRHWVVDDNYESHKSTFLYPYTIHCVAETKAAAKWLQAATAKALITFRRALYEYGVDHISPLNGGPPQRITFANNTQAYNCTIQFMIRMEDDWWLDKTGDWEEKISISLRGTIYELEYDESGNLTSPNVEQEITIG